MVGAMRRDILKGTAAAALVASSSARALGGANAPAPTGSEAQAWLARAFATKPAPAISAAVAEPEGLRWAGAVGQVNLELAVPATAGHCFPLGSVSKVVASTLAARLALRGVLDLDAPISEALPELPAQHRQTTLRQLLTHRGGVRHYTAGEVDMGNPAGAVFMRIYASDSEALALFIDDPLVAPPGSEVNYSSYGYALASMAMAATAGRPFLDLVESEIAKPFDLPSLVPNDPWRIIGQRAGQYMNDLDLRMFGASSREAARPDVAESWANLPFNNPAYCWAGAGLLMTPSDTARFGAAMIESPAGNISAAERDLLLTAVTQPTKTSPPLGLGWRVDADKKGRRRWHHAGATPGGCHLLAIYPDQRLAVAIAGNVMTMKMNMLQGASELIDCLAR